MRKRGDRDEGVRKDPRHSNDPAPAGGPRCVPGRLLLPPGPTAHTPASQEFSWSVEPGQKTQVERKHQSSLVTHTLTQLFFNSPQTLRRATGSALTRAPTDLPPSISLSLGWHSGLDPVSAASSLASADVSKLLCEAARPCLGSPVM